jgi:hypothetical protein
MVSMARSETSFKPGQSGGNQGGRKPGSQNVITPTKKEAFKALMEGKLEWMVEQIDKLPDIKDQLDYYLSLMPYYKPKLSSSDLTVRAEDNLDTSEMRQVSLETRKKILALIEADKAKTVDVEYTDEPAKVLQISNKPF